MKVVEQVKKKFFDALIEVRRPCVRHEVNNFLFHKGFDVCVCETCSIRGKFF